MSYRHATYRTDQLESYHNVLPRAQHQPSYKGSGQTNHIERFNNTLRQRFAQLVRKTLAFDKCSRRLEITAELFIHRYNAEIRLSYLG